MGVVEPTTAMQLSCEIVPARFQPIPLRLARILIAVVASTMVTQSWFVTIQEFHCRNKLADVLWLVETKSLGTLERGNWSKWPSSWRAGELASASLALRNCPLFFSTR